MFFNANCNMKYVVYIPSLEIHFAVCGSVRACVSAVCVCVRACVRAYVRVCVWLVLKVRYFFYQVSPYSFKKYVVVCSSHNQNFLEEANLSIVFRAKFRGLGTLSWKTTL